MSKSKNSTADEIVYPDALLAEVVGSKPMPRREVTVKLWDYIKRNKLQAEDDNRYVVADEKLLPIFRGQKELDMFEMTKLVAEHMIIIRPKS